MSSDYPSLLATVRREMAISADLLANNFPSLGGDLIPRSLLSNIDAVEAAAPPPGLPTAVSRELARGRAMALALLPGTSGYMGAHQAAEEGFEGDNDGFSAFMMVLDARAARIATAERAQEDVCGGCGAAAPSHTCSRCGRARYCNIACQRTAWRSGHKAVCIAPSRPASSDGAAGVPYGDVQTFGYAPPAAPAPSAALLASRAAFLREAGARLALTAAERAAASRAVAALGGEVQLSMMERHKTLPIIQALFADSPRKLTALLLVGLPPSLLLSSPCPQHDGRMEPCSLLYMSIYALEQRPVSRRSSAGEAVALLLGAGAALEAGNTAEGATPLLAAARCRDPGSLRALLAAGADVRAARSEDGTTALHDLLAAMGERRFMATPADAAAWRARGLECLAALLPARPPLEAATRDGWTPLLMAVDTGREELVRTLLAAGAHREARGGLNTTPMALALQRWGSGAPVVAALREEATQG